MLETGQVAIRLNCSQRHVVWLIAEGRLIGVNIGIGEKRPTWRVPEDALEAYIKTRTSGIDQVRDAFYRKRGDL